MMMKMRDIFVHLGTVPAIKRMTAGMALCLFGTVAGLASPTSALKDYQSGNFTNALTEYTKIAAVKTNDLRLVFNAGDAAYRATNFALEIGRAHV